MTIRPIPVFHLAVIVSLITTLTACSGAPTPTVPFRPGSTRVSEKDGMLQVYVPAGEFLMGSTSTDIDDVMKVCSYCLRDWFQNEMPQHRVYLDAFWIDKTEVTNAMFAQFVAETGYQTDAERIGAGIDFRLSSYDWAMTQGANWRHPHGPTSDINGLDDHPVVQVSGNDAEAYCAWAGRRLPTEAEWEKAARGTDGRIYPWGNQPPAGNLLNFGDRNLNGNQSDNSVDDGYMFTAPVGSYPAGASPYGALDMAGNVGERVTDWYSDTYYAHSPERNPTGPSSGDHHIIRGGSWSRMFRYVRVASRYPYLQLNRSSGLGFRCASTSVPVTQSTQQYQTTPAPTFSLEETSMKDFVISDFDAVHAPVKGDTNEYLIFGNLPISPSAADLPPELAAFLGRWEGYDYSPPVKKDYKLVVVVQEINSQGGKAYIWAGTNLQYPSMVKEIHFRVVWDTVPSIEFETTLNGTKKTIIFAYDSEQDILRGPGYSFKPIELSRSRTFHVYKDYAQYLAGKRIYPREYRDDWLRRYYGPGYLLYLPQGYEDDPKRTWPLILFLHGSGDRGDNLFLLAKASPFMMIREKGPLPFIIVAPLLNTSEYYASFPENYLDGAMDEILMDFRIDRRRIYMTGLSMGGEATYRYALHQPDMFAAIAPLAAYLSSPPSMDPIKDLPVWAIHGADDFVVPLTLAQQPVEALKQAGGDIRFTIMEGHDHDVWTDTYSDPQFYDWLLEHQKP